VIHDMYESNPKAWRIVQHVMHTLMGLPCTIGLHFDECYWKQPEIIC
jgi:hypothetical protein